jgi:holo-[acyl-carrier protein] synthase
MHNQYERVMHIIGHAISTVENTRLREILDRHGKHFLDHCFTQREQLDSLGSKRDIEHLAGRFAAKRAVMKILWEKLGGGAFWTDVEIIPNHAGKPTIHLSGKCASIAHTLGIIRWHVSISHITTETIASVIGEGN